MRIRLTALTALTLAAAVMLLTGCSKGTSNNTNANTGNTSSASPTATTNTTQPSATATPTISDSGPSPTAAFTAYYEAIKRKDVEAVQSLFSKGTLSMMEERAKKTNKSLDAVMKEGLEEAGNDVPAEIPKTRNEKVDGDKATLEVRNDKQDKWELVHFAKEDGQWKIAFDEDK